MAEDTVCLSDSLEYLCADDFNFFVAESCSNTTIAYAGVLGLGAPYSSNGPSFY
jgi:hypothetical protein